MPPLPPHELGKGEPPHPPVPPHERKRKGLVRRLFFSLVAGLAITAVTSGIIWFSGISINVVLPVAAPILVGSTTLAYTVLVDRG